MENRFDKIEQTIERLSSSLNNRFNGYESSEKSSFQQHAFSPFANEFYPSKNVENLIKSNQDFELQCDKITKHVDRIHNS